MQWYKVIGARGHVGAGKYAEATLFIKARSIVHALGRYKHVPAMKKSKNKRHLGPRNYSSSQTPSLTIMLAKPSELESIVKDPNFNPKKHWFYFADPRITHRPL